MTHAMVLKKYDPRVDYFNTAIDHLKDSGLMEAFSQKHFQNMKDPEETLEEPLVLEHFLVPFIFLACGLSLATMKLLTEMQFVYKAITNIRDMSCKI